MKKRMATKKAAAVMMTAVMATSMFGGVVKAEEDPFAFDSVSDVTFPLAETLELDVFVYATATGGGTYQTNYVTDWIEEKTNIKLNFVYDLDGDDAKTKLNLLMTDTGNLPDIFLATNWTKSELQSYGQQGLLLPLNEYLEEAVNWQALNEACPSRKADLTMSDGNIYTYGDSNECFHCMYQNRMWIYMPWVESLNDGKVPETTEELYEYLVKVKNNDPNGNGIADEIPMTGYIGGWATDPTVWLINSFIQCNNPLSNTNPTIGAGLVVNEDGQIEYSVMQEGYQEAMKYINKLYAEGLLDNQTFTQDATQFSAVVDNAEENLVALHPGGALTADSAHFWAQEEGSWQDWMALEPVEGPDGVRLAARSITDYFASCVGCISANCEYPEIVVALFDFLASEEGTLVQSYGPQGLTWDYVDGGTALNGGEAEWSSTPLPDDYDWVGNGYKQDYGTHNYWTSDAMIGSRTAAYRGAQLIENPDLNTEYVLQEAAERYSQYAPDESTLVPNLVFEGQDAQTISEGTITIGGYVNQATVQFITGDMDPEKDWDTYISKLQDMGVENFLNIYQTTYDAYIANAQ